MAGIQAVQKYNQFEKLMAGEAERQWTDASAGNHVFYLAKGSYTPSAAHTTVANLGVADVDYIATGEGMPIIVATPTLDDTTTPGTTYWNSADANFGSNVTISAKFLICAQPVAASGTPVSDATDKLLWYCDLDNTTTSTEVSSSGSTFNVAPATNGWIKST